MLASWDFRGGILLHFIFRRIALLLCLFAVQRLSAQEGYFANWFKRVKETQAEQPHWLTPLFTTTPRLEEEFRSDIVWTPVAGGTNMNYGAGKGLELIPTKQTEIILGVPPYQVPLKGSHGFGNIPLLLKYRFLTGNEEHGNYIITAFLGGSIPYGRFASEYGSVTPTLAFGKGRVFHTTLGHDMKTGNDPAYHRLLANGILWACGQLP